MEAKKPLKKLLPTVLAGVLLLILALINTFVLPPERGEETEEPRQVEMLSFGAGEVDEIEASWLDKAVELRWKEGRWMVEKNGDLFPVASHTAESLAESLASLKAERKLEGDLPLSDYGLASPSRKIVFKRAGKEVLRLEVGDKTPAEDAYYAKISAEEAVFVVTTWRLDEFFREANDFRERQISRFDTAKAKKLEVVAGKKRWSWRKEGESWVLVKPKKKKGAGLHEKADLLLTTIANLSILAFEDDRPSDLATYGLKAPRYRVSVSADREVTLLVGGKKGTDLYVKTEDEDPVYLAGGFVEDKITELIEEAEKKEPAPQKKEEKKQREKDTENANRSKRHPAD